MVLYGIAPSAMLPDMRNRIRELRLSAGMTLEQLAEVVGTSTQQMGRLETGKRKLTQDWMEKIAPRLGVEPAFLMVQGPGAPPRGETIYDPTEIKLVNFWRELEPGARALVLSMMQAPISGASSGAPDVDTVIRPRQKVS